MSPVDFSVVIPVFNKWELTRDCLASLREHTSGDCFEVIVVDNASGDDTVRELEPFGTGLFGPRFTAIRHEENRNFSGACNAGARAAKAPVVFFLNNDTLLTPHWAPPLLDALRGSDKVGAVGPLLLYADDTVQHLGVYFSTKGIGHLYQHFPRAHPVVRRQRRHLALTAAALMMPRALFLDLGGFHEGYKNGFEDVELTTKIVKSKKSLHCVTESVVYHLESQSPGRSAHERHNADLLLARCGTDFEVDLHRHGMQDGFDVKINDELGISLLCGPEEEARLHRETRGADPDTIQQVFLENPLWLSGALELARLCENKGVADFATHFYLRALAIYPSWQLVQRAMRVAQASTVESEKQLMQKYYDILGLLHTDRSCLHKQFNLILGRAQLLGDRALERLLLDKRRALFD